MLQRVTTMLLMQRKKKSQKITMTILINLKMDAEKKSKSYYERLICLIVLKERAILLNFIIKQHIF